VVRRIRLQSEYIDLILEEQFLLVLRSEAAVMSHSELLLANIEENRVRIQALLPAMKVELLLHWRADGAAITEAAKFFDAQIPAIRGKQLALRGRTLTGRDKLSNAQVKFYVFAHFVSLHLLYCLVKLKTHCFCFCFCFVVAR
jgi:hypothetical protein